MTARLHNPESGFTLAETLVAMFIFALLATAGGGVLTQTLQGKARLEAETARLADLAALHSTLKSDLGQASLRLARDARGHPVLFAGGLTDDDPALLTLVRRGWANPQAAERRSSLMAVTYTLRDGALVRTAALAPDSAPGTPTRERVLMENVTAVRLRFLSHGAWSDVWRQGVRGAALPDAVEITLDVAGTGELRMLFIAGAGMGVEAAT